MDNPINPADAAAGTSAITDGSSLDKQTPGQPDAFKNLKGEFNRKLSKMEQKLDAVLNAFSTNRPTNSVAQQPVDETAEVDTDVKQYVDTVFTRESQKTAWQEALSMFPELNPESEQFDERFYKAVDSEFSNNQLRDPRGPLKAAKLAALEMGKIEALTKANILKDEARRSRIMSEGISTPREAKKEKDASAHFNAGNLAKLGINAEKLAKRLKENKDKYGV